MPSPSKGAFDTGTGRVFAGTERYEVVRKIGEGGMGVVYAAEQLEPVRRRVAIKLIRTGGGDTGEVTARFGAERQALAVMEHPAIAKVYDAGVTPDGAPYFVMEYLEGMPITEWCDAHAASTEQRLRLFIEVCRAIQHAHGKGIIHRDLKPGNILVTEQAGRPLPKVIDFGIAKAVDLRLGEQSLVTQHGQLLGTPAYMAPEQADGDGIDIDTRADIYALGVMLYELLVGRLPLDPKEMGFLPFIARLVMRQTNPPTPSARLVTLAEEGPAIAARRQTDIVHLRREVAGDLDWVTMRALDPERDRRYATAVALAEDLERHLRDEPVTARPPTTGYRLQKFVRRNRGAVLAGVLAMVALVGGTVTTAIGMVKASRAERVALREAATARAVADFLVDLFRSAEPTFASGGNLTARDLLDRGVADVETRLRDQPVVKARVLSTLGDAYGGLGFFDAAEQLHRRALTLVDSVLSPGDTAIAAHLDRLADAIALNAVGGYRAAGAEVRAMRERALRIRKRHLSEDTTAWLGALSAVAWARQASGATDSALAQLDSARAALAPRVGPGNRHVLLLRDLRARLLINDGRYADAVATLETLLADTVVSSPFWSQTVRDGLRNNLAGAYGEVGRAADAVTIYEDLLANLGRDRDSSTAPTYEPSMFNLAAAYASVGAFDAAAAVWDQVTHRVDAIHRDDPTQANPYRIDRAVAEGQAGRWDLMRATLDTAIPIALAAMNDPRIGTRAH
ncbi:MAG: serine/threonine protein kinase, partial [Gemmatimonadetes bacterium]|nr:serine/threonine protein kinase [Gemmatimonadota bacterium]